MSNLPDLPDQQMKDHLTERWNNMTPSKKDRFADQVKAKTAKDDEEEDQEVKNGEEVDQESALKHVALVQVKLTIPDETLVFRPTIYVLTF